MLTCINKFVVQAKNHFNGEEFEIGNKIRGAGLLNDIIEDNFR